MSNDNESEHIEHPKERKEKETKISWKTSLFGNRTPIPKIHSNHSHFNLTMYYILIRNGSVSSYIFFSFSIPPSLLSSLRFLLLFYQILLSTLYEREWHCSYNKVMLECIFSLCLLTCTSLIYLPSTTSPYRFTYTFSST